MRLQKKRKNVTRGGGGRAEKCHLLFERPIKIQVKFSLLGVLICLVLHVKKPRLQPSYYLSQEILELLNEINIYSLLFDKCCTSYI